MEVAVVTIGAEDVRPLRGRLLRPGQSADELVYPGDSLPGALHLGAYLRGDLVGIASVSPESPPGEDDDRAWRVRGMATAPEVRGAGVGGALLEACLAHVRAHGGRVAWCNARTPAVGFYQRFGFATEGEEFDIPGIGPHFVMRRALG